MMQGERQIEFNRGKVAYKGQSEIYCNYAKVVNPDGTEVFYYFLNDLDNGCYIASTDLKEAIDPDISKAFLGLLNKKGDIIIPFENKSLKVVDDKYLLAVRNQPQTPSVLEAIASRNDPTAAERMVNANASIKDKLNKAMSTQSVSSKFILNDLLSEGTVYTLDGHNLFDNQYFSFIGMTPDSFFGTTNVPEDEVKEFPVNAPVKSASLLQNMPVVEPEAVVPEVQVKSDPLDVSSVQVSKNTIDSALDTIHSDNTEVVSHSALDEQEIDLPSSVAEDTFEKPLNEIKLDSIFSPLSEDARTNNDENNESTSLDQDSTNNIPSFDSTSDTSDVSRKDSDDTEESFSDVVSAVGGLVQENQKQKQELKKKDLKIISLQERIQKMQQQSQDNARLIEENARLQQENEHLKQRVYQLVEGYNQMREALSTPAAYGTADSQSYKKVA